jgi:hypothetical protein
MNASYTQSVLYFERPHNELVLYTTRSLITDESALECAQAWADKDNIVLYVYCSYYDDDETGIYDDIYKHIKIVRPTNRWVDIDIPYNMAWCKWVDKKGEMGFIWSDKRSRLAAIKTA